MRLRSLRLAGFKSFADRTEFQFPDGITCVVGPNGCGKSNVVDALKWVLGEQRPTALRGSEMLDVLFGGTATRKPLGLAEVSLVLDNADGRLPVDFSEIEVTRRLYRDGTSEYLLNRSPCRLRDLRELLMDTGSGPGAMSLMEQGRIDQILREGVEERRAVFEEAAGISKYKARRKEALRKLERVEADLLRVTDVVAEKDRLVRSLKIQAGRAERYKALVDEMRGKRLVLALHRYGSLLAERSVASGRVLELTAAEDAARAQVREAVAGCRLGEDELESRRSLIVRKEQEVAGLQTQADAAREKGAFAARLASELEGKIRWYVDEIENGAARLAELESTSRDVTGLLRATEDERAVRQSALAAAEKGIEGARTVAQERRAASQRLAERAYDNLSRQSRLGSLRSKLDAETRGLGDRRSRLDERLERLSDELGRCRLRLETAEAESRTAAERRDAAATSLSTGEERASALETSIRAQREGVGALDRDVSGLRSRVEVLRALEARREGVAEGPRRFLDAARKEPGAFPAIRGLFTDLIETDADAAGDVETALGAFATAIVVETFADAELGVRAARDRKLPRCILLPLDAMSPIEPAAGLRGLSSSVRCADDVRAAVDALLGDAVPAPDLGAARALRHGADAGTGRGLRVVLSDGTVVESSGAVSGGGPAGGAGLLQRRNELRDLSARLDETAARLTEARAELVANETALTETRRQVAASREALRAAESAFHRIRGDSERARADVARLEGERGHLDRERIEIDAELDRTRAESAKAAEESDRVAAEQAEIEVARADAAKRLERAEQELRAAEDLRSEARAGLAGVVERCASYAARLQSIEREIRDLEGNVAEARKELTACEGRKSEAEERGREAARAHDQAQRRREECVQELMLLRHEASLTHTALESRRKMLEALESDASKVAQDLHRFRLQENEARLRVENLLERCREELDADLARVWEERSAAAPDAESQPPVYAQAPAPTPEELGALEADVAELRSRVEKMGAVNLEALGQLEEADRDATHMKAQLDDLTRSRESLLQAIRKIDHESRAQFEQTFALIRTNFQEMYRKLFGGGRADVFLTEGQDVLEAGIEIVARPPGKEQRSISLLSGGERTMTAVALLFAIYLAKPSPFCLMDEVDAALDETNIDRFVGVLTEFAQQSQFIIVSHNKRTISAAGTIFGVSMPEPGVSRKIAVRLDDVADDGQLRAAAG